MAIRDAKSISSLERGIWRKKHVSSLALAFWGIFPAGVSTAIAQEGALAIEEVTVTARRMEESLQDAPISVTALAGEELYIRGALDLTDLSAVSPNLSFVSGATSSGSSVTPTVYIRGIGQPDFLITFDPAVGVYIDGVYVARTISSLGDITGCNCMI